MENSARKNFEEKNITNCKSISINYSANRLSSKEKFRLWIKTLLGSIKIFPEILKTIDKIIEIQATTISFMTDVYNSSNSTFSQAEQIIDLSDRKQSVLNIYLMLQNILKNTEKGDYEFLEKKFIDKLTINELAEEYNVSSRTIYRRTEKILDSICKRCMLKNWSLNFIETQVKDEAWLIQKYKRMVYEYIKSSGIAIEKI